MPWWSIKVLIVKYLRSFITSSLRRFYNIPDNKSKRTVFLHKLGIRTPSKELLDFLFDNLYTDNEKDECQISKNRAYDFIIKYDNNHKIVYEMVNYRDNYGNSIYCIDTTNYFDTKIPETNLTKIELNNLIMRVLEHMGVDFKIFDTNLTNGIL